MSLALTVQSVPKPEINLDNVQQAFMTSWKPTESFEFFCRRIDEMHLKVLDDKEGKTPNYSFVTQSSGYGKSRLLGQLYQKFNTAYMCLRPFLSNGYPRRTNEIFVFLDGLRGKSSTVAEAELKRFLGNILLQYQEFLLENQSNDILEARRVLASSDTEFFHSFWKSVVTKENEERPSAFPSEVLVLVIDEARFLSQTTIGETNLF